MTQKRRPARQSVSVAASVAAAVATSAPADAACETGACDIAPATGGGVGAGFDVDALDGLFKGFADPTRLRLLSALVAGELCVCDLVDLLGVSQPTVSRHLAYLRRAGLVEVTREWKFAHYRLATPASAVHTTLLACVRSCFTGVPPLDAERRAAERRVRARDAAPCE